MNTPQLLRAVLYTRVSTGEQVKHGTSLATPFATCRLMKKQNLLSSNLGS